MIISYFKSKSTGSIHEERRPGQNIFLLYPAPTCYNTFTTNQCLIFPLTAPAHHAFVLYLWMKHFVGNVSRQAFGAQSILMYTPIIQRHLNKEI